ncbi:MAG: hypothetical protein KKA07_11635 [Bacteroidetes bacterium]|nr:hypothetical protein [Bacteroidota bacterium]MBU1719710.1 hypothetical protein [Bacteroidota bacterium]
MVYLELFNQLKAVFTQEPDQLDTGIDDVMISNFDFESLHYNILPGEDHYFHPETGEEFQCKYNFQSDVACPETSEYLNLRDSKLVENRYFRYSVFHSKKQKTLSNAIVLFHGFNEKNWDKYLPWAFELHKKTNKAVILFPIAFHMNRAPEAWSHLRSMQKVRDERKIKYPQIISSSLANVSISVRLQTIPERYFWSGFQTYYDVVSLLDGIANGNHPLFDNNSQFDLFSYSIGGFFSEILLMANPKNYFGNSKLFIFCGGPVFNRLSPVSKFILDSESNVALYSFLIEHLESALKDDERLEWYLSTDHPEGRYFRCMLNYNKMIGIRESRFKEIGKRILALGLEKDSVVPPYEIRNTLKGTSRRLPAKVKIADYPFSYSHEIPFPLMEKNAKSISKAFYSMINIAGKHLG